MRFLKKVLVLCVAFACTSTMVFADTQETTSKKITQETTSSVEGTNSEKKTTSSDETTTAKETTSSDETTKEETTSVEETTSKKDSATKKDLDLSGFKEANIKDYICVYKDNLYVKVGCKYCFVYSDNKSFYDKYISSGAKKFTADELNEYIRKEDNYRGVGDALDFGYIGHSLQSMSEGDYKNLYAFIKEGDTLLSLGSYSFNELEKLLAQDLDKKEPEVKYTVELNKDNKAVVKVTYKTVGYNTKIRGIEIVDEDGAIYGSYKPNKKDSKSGKCSFILSSNAKFIIKTQYDISSYTETDLVIDCIKSDTNLNPDDDVYDVDSPVITYSDFPKSASDPVEITIFTDEPAVINFDGNVTKDYVTELKVTLEFNGTYYINAIDKAGNETETNLKVSFFDEGDDGDKETQKQPDVIWSDENRDSYWEEIGLGGEDDGNGDGDNGGDADSSGSNNGSSSNENKLPQTGGRPLTYFIIIGSLLSVGGIAIFKLAMRKKLSLSNGSVIEGAGSDSDDSNTTDTK